MNSINLDQSVDSTTDTSGKLERKSRVKKWSQVYVDKIESDRCDRELKNFYRQQEIQRAWAVALISRKFVARLRIKVAVRRSTSEHTFKNSHTLMFTKWEPHLGTQVLCQHCQKPGYNDCVGCMTCNTIVHSYCLPMQSKVDAQMRRYKCGECVALYMEEKARHSHALSRRKDEKLRLKHGYLLAKLLMSYLLRRRFKKQRISAIVIQACIRRFIQRSKFVLWRSHQMRVIVIEIRDLPTVFEGSTIVITIVDTMKYTQIFRYDRTCDKFNISEPVSFLLPGITKNVYLVVTVASKDESGQLLAWRAQSQCSLQDVMASLKSVSRQLRFGSTVQYAPHAVYGQQEARKAVPVQPLPALANEMCTIRMKPLNPILSPCMQVHGPPLDILRKQGDIYANAAPGKKQDRVSERRSKWWICIADSKLCFYQFFGDSFPRYYVFMKDASVNISRTFPMSVQLHFADRRKWQLDCRSGHEAQKLACAVREWKKIADSTSLFAAQDSAHEQPFTITFS